MLQCGTEGAQGCSSFMELRELLGYFLLIVAISGIVAAIWAAVHYSHHKVYNRTLRRERRERREASSAIDSRT